MGVFGLAATAGEVIGGGALLVRVEEGAETAKAAEPFRSSEGRRSGEDGSVFVTGELPIGDELCGLVADTSGTAEFDGDFTNGGEGWAIFGGCGDVVLGTSSVVL